MAGHPYPMRYNPYRHNPERAPLSRNAKIGLGIAAAVVVIGVPVAIVAVRANREPPAPPVPPADPLDYDDSGSVVLGGHTWDWEVQHSPADDGQGLEFWWFAASRETGAELQGGGMTSYDETLDDMFKTLREDSPPADPATS